MATAKRVSKTELKQNMTPCQLSFARELEKKTGSLKAVWLKTKKIWWMRNERD